MATAKENQRTFITHKFALEIGKVGAGLVESAEGGYAFSNVIVERVGADHIQHKHIAGVQYEDIAMAYGTGMSRDFYEWIKASFDNRQMRRDGTVHTCDYDGNIVSTLDFHQAAISEVGFPALDAASKDAAKMTIKFAPEWTVRKKGEGRIDLSKFGGDRNETKKWLLGNFRLKIQGLDEATSAVNRIEALVLKRNLAGNAGEIRTYPAELPNLEVPTLVVTCDESHADGVYKWHEDFVVKGINGQDKEKGGILECFTDLGAVLFTLTFHNLGIFRCAPEKPTPDGENIGRVKFEMYCEKVDFSYSGAAS